MRSPSKIPPIRTSEPPAKRGSKPPERKSTTPPLPEDPVKHLQFITRRGVISALMNNDIGCALPITVSDKEEDIREEDIHPIGFADEAYLSSLQMFHPEAYELFCQFADFLEKGAGVKIDDIKALDPNNTEMKNRMAQQIEKAIVNGLECLSQYKTLELRKKEMAKFHREANRHYEEIIKEYFPKEKEYLSWQQTAINIEDNVGRLAMEFLGDGDSKMRAQAKLKFFFMLKLAIKENSNPANEPDKSLPFLRDLILNRIAHYHPHEKRAATFDMALNTVHSKEDFRTLSFEISEQEAEREAFHQSKTIGLRRMRIIDEDGEEKFIKFRMEVREKDLNKKASKELRYGDEELNPDYSDDNGARFIFESVEDARMFETMLVNELQKIYDDTLTLEKANAIKRGDNETASTLSKRLDRKLQCVSVIGDEKISIGVDERGNTKYKKTTTRGLDPKQAFERIDDSLTDGEHRGHSEGSSKNFKVRSYNLLYNHPSDETYKYEFQVMLFDGYVDMDYRKGVNIEEYHTNRVFLDKGGLIQLCFSQLIYPRLNIEEARKRKIKSIRIGVRNLMDPNREKSIRATKKELRKRERELRAKEGDLETRERNARRRKEEWTRIKEENALLKRALEEAQRAMGKKKKKVGRGKKK